MFKNFKLQSRISKWVLLIFLGVSLFISLLFISVYAGLWGKLPNAYELKELQQSQATEILSDDGTLLGKYYIFDRQPVVYKELPQHLINALIATEDVRFYEHSGIDQRSLLRVFVKSLLMQDESSGGGSTITLQLAKNLFGRNDYGSVSIVINKIREAIIAKRLERIYSKEEILTLYLNTVPFSDNTYGIESAARKFFSTTTSGLSLVEAATLVGTLKASNYYNPRAYPERSEHRRNVVLHQMGKYDFISPKEVEEAQATPLTLKYKYFSLAEGIAPYFRENLRQEVKKMLDTLRNPKGEPYNLYHDGLKIHTTIDYGMQEIAEEAMSEHMPKLQEEFEKSHRRNPPWLKQEILKEAIKRTEQYESLAAAGWSEAQIMDSLNRKKEMELFDWGKKTLTQASYIDSLQHYLKFLNIGMINLDPNSGAVKSYVGGINYENFKYDHVAQSERQVGSTFKPIVYTAAMEAGLDPCRYYSVREVTYAGGWTPSNATQEEDPFVNYSMEYALSRSINTIAVKVLYDVGLRNVITRARKMGITSHLPEYPSIALGTPEIGVDELAKAYSSYVNRGIPVDPYYITKIEDKSGNIIYEYQPDPPREPAFSNTTRQILLEMMQTTVNSGTASRLRYKYNLKNDIAGKTGTTQDNRDGWFVGITPNLLSVTWVGADNHQIGFRTTSMGQGANSALPVFALMMQKMNQDSTYNEITQAKFPPPSSTVRSMLDCPPMERDNFLERLFGNPDDPEEEQADEEEEKSGIFSKIKDIFKKKEE